METPRIPTDKSHDAQVTIRFPTADLARVERAAHDDDRPRASFIRRAAVLLAEQHERGQTGSAGR